jgi:hypothetical protein
MDDSEEVKALKAELAALIRKMLARNLYVEQDVSRICRGIRYEEMASLPPPEERH